MPELPEVETTKRGIGPHIIGQYITDVCIHQPNLRWPVSENLATNLCGAKLTHIQRRAKYLLFSFNRGYLAIHLGMSGNLCITDAHSPTIKHGHVEFIFQCGKMLRYIDPRRFGAVLWLGKDYQQHPLFSKLGPEPLSDTFNGHYLWQITRKKQRPIKSLIMDQSIVTGVGNIYATEALFFSGIYPATPACQLNLTQCIYLCDNVQQILTKAIAKGGTTLKDFIGNEGKAGYFQQQLHAYGRKGKPCTQCLGTLKELRINNRGTTYCPVCQP